MKSIKLLVKLRWRCAGRCNKKAQFYTDYLPKGTSGDDWYEQYWKGIVAPGVNRRCLECAGEATQESKECDLCPQHKLRSDYTPGMWLHRHDRKQRAMCKLCCNPPCTAKGCKTCRVCWDVNCRNQSCTDEVCPLNSNHLPKTLEGVRQYICSGCGGNKCDVCGQNLPKTAYSSDMWQNRHKDKRRTFCKNCSRP